MRRKPGSLRHRFKTPNGASRRSAQAPAAAQYTPPQRQQPHYYTATAATQCGRIRYAPASSASRRKMRPAATHAGKTNHRRTRTRCKVKGDAEKHLLFHNPRLRTRSQSPAERHKAKCRKRVGSPATRSRPPSRRCEPSPLSRRSKRPPRAPVFCSPWPAGRRSPRPRTKSS